MLVFNNDEKDKINILLNTDNFYGKFTGGLSRVLIFILVASVPFMVYSLLLINFLSIKIFLPIYILYVIRVALLILGREKERLNAFIKQRNDEYATANDLIQIADIHEDGLIEYQDGMVCYIIQAFSYSYIDDNKYSKDLEEFISKLTNKYEVDIYGHVVVGEYDIKQEDLEKLRVYSDKEFLKERLEFYKYQDRYANEHSTLYRLNFVVRDYKSGWVKMKQELDGIIKSDLVQCFDLVKLCNKQEANDVISRDITLYVDLGEMLRAKHKSDNYFGSKVLFFDDEIPDSLLDKESIKDDMEERRVVDVS